MVLKASEIVWIEAEDYYVLVHSKQGRHLVRATLASFEQRLDPRIFLRVHRTAIVNVDEVRTVRDDGRLLLTLSSGAEVGRQPVAPGAGRATACGPGCADARPHTDRRTLQTRAFGCKRLERPPAAKRLDSVRSCND